MAEGPARRVLLVALAAVALSVATGPAPAAGVPVPVSRQAVDEGPQLPVDPRADPDRTRARADDILERREYQAPGRRDRTLLDRVRRWVGDRVPEVDGPEGGDDALDLASIVVIAVVVGAAVVGLVLVLRSARRTRRVPDEAADVEVDVTPLRSATEWGAEADRCERAGDHRGAVRARFRGLTTTLADRGLVADTPGRTAGELRADLAGRAPALSPQFDAVANLFEEVWFGDATAGPDQSRTARDLAGRVVEAAPRRADALVGAAPEPG